MHKILTISLLVLISYTTVLAGVTGKIDGVVIDSKTGQPLPGANVIIVGTMMGAATDDNGYYVILNVPIGIYDIKSAMIGYAPMTIKDVKVSIDLTTKINFELTPQVIEAAEIVVVAERPLLRKDEFTSRHIVTAEEIEVQPIDDFRQIARNQAGVIGDHYRGGRPGEVLVLIDGIPVRDPAGTYSGNLGNFTADIPEASIQEMDVTLGGFSAEYGNVQSGILNIATKEGSSIYSGMFRFISTDFGPKLNDLLMGRRDRWYNVKYQHKLENIYQFSLGGPGMFSNLILKSPNIVNFSISGEITDRKQGYFINQQGYYQTYQGKLTLKLSPRTKLSLGGLYTLKDWDQFYFPASKYGPGDDYIENEYKKVEEGTLYHYIYVKDPYNYEHRSIDSTGVFGEEEFNKVQIYYVGGMQDYLWNYRQNSRSGYLILTHTLTPKTFYEIKYQSFFTNYHYATPDVEDRDKDGDTKEDLVWDRDKLDCPHPIYRELVDNYWWVRGDDPGYRNQVSFTNLIKVDLVSQATRGNLIKGGVELGLHQMDVENVSWTLGVGAERKDIWKENTIDLGMYIQDKMEFEGIIALVGIRYDYFDPNGWGEPVYFPANYNTPISGFDDTTGIGILIDPRKPKPKSQISPRIAISHPITDRDVIHFSYGHYFQRPDAYYLYRNLKFQALTKVGNYIGSPDLIPEKTVSYEVGIEHLFTSSLKGTITGYYKDVTNLMNWRKFVGRTIQNIELNVFTNADYGNMKGLEFTLAKRMGKYLGGSLNYTYSIAKGRSSSSGSGYGAFTSERRINILDFDQTHTINANITILTPKESIFDFKIGKFTPFANWRANIQFRYGSGLPYSSFGTGFINDKRMPETTTTDLRLNKQIRLAGARVDMFMDVFNLFNRQNVEWIGDIKWYEIEGDPAIVRAVEIGTEREYIRNPQVYGDKRQFRFGLAVQF